jgi:DNA-binding CsgD family transcriptional regulator
MRTGDGEALVAGFGRTEREFSERDRDVLDIVRPASRPRCGPRRRAGASSVLSRPSRRRGQPARMFGRPEVLGEPTLGVDARELDLAVAVQQYDRGPRLGWWLALPPRPPLVSARDGRRPTVRLLPGDPLALLLEEEFANFRTDVLDRLGLTPREAEVLRAAAAIEDEAEIARELFLSLHAVRERLERLEAKPGVRTAADAVARALRESA